MYHIEICHMGCRQTYQNFYNEYIIRKYYDQLRPHQLDAVKQCFVNTKGQVIVPTGGGKTMCMIEDVKKLFRQNSLLKQL